MTLRNITKPDPRPAQRKSLHVAGLSTLFSIAFSLSVSATSGIQEQKLSLDVENQTIKEVLFEIERSSGFRFIYESERVNLDKRVTLHARDRSVEQILARLFQGEGIAYEITDNHFILINPAREAEKSQQAQPSTRKRAVSGTVTDERGEPIIGANVVEKGTTNGTITDLDGHFTLEVSGKATLLISYIGYSQKEIAMTDATSIYPVRLKEDTQSLDEVVVVGYGTVKRANLGGAVATADSKAFESRPVQNAASALQGEIPGLTITRSGGAPGSDMTLKVRDVSSINGGSPLILIDGAEGDINLINPADIESISVLKDGTAAIYGARASDGVILVTTKNGKRGQKTSVAFDTYYSIKTPALLRRPANLLQHAEMALEITDGSFPVEYTKEELELIRQGNEQVLPDAEWGRWTGYPKFFKNQDWNKMLIGNGNMQNYNVNISGGGERYSYMISLGHQREAGIPKFGKDINKRYFTRAKSSVELIKHLTYDLNLAYEASHRDYSSGLTEGQNIWELIYKTRSWTPMRNPAGGWYTFEGFDNPAQVLEEGGMVNKTTGNITVNNQLRWEITQGIENSQL